MPNLAGKDVNLWIKHPTYTDDQWWMGVCSTGLSLDFASNENSTTTKCGVFTVAGPDDITATLDLVFVKGEPAPNEFTAKTIKAIHAAKATFDFRICDAYPSAVDIDDVGNGFISQRTDDHPAEGFSTMSITIKVNGGITSNIV